MTWLVISTIGVTTCRTPEEVLDAVAVHQAATTGAVSVVPHHPQHPSCRGAS